jgi:hypothetical protein
VKKYVLILLGALLSFLFSVPVLAAPCEPKQVNGTGTRLVIGGNDKGNWTYYWCQGKYGPSLVWKAATDLTLAKTIAKEASGFDSPLTAYRTLWAKYGLTEPTTPEFVALKSAMILEAQETRPLDPKWVITTNGTAATRPSYWLTAGKKGTAAVRNAPIKNADGTPVLCGCAMDVTRYVTSTTTYCPFYGSMTKAESVEVVMCSAAK